MQAVRMDLVPHEYIPKYFKVHELVHPDEYKAYASTPHRLWWAFDNRLLWTADQLREKYGSIVINNWYKANGNGYTVSDGSYKSCGLRSMADKVGAALSQHRFGRALDLHFTKITAQAVIGEMDKMGLFKSGSWRADPDPVFDPFRYITVIERTANGVPCTWLHIDTRNQLSPNGGIIALDV